MNMRFSLVISFITLALLSACAGKDTAVFVTSTSLSLLEGDTKPAGVSIAYKRVEGYLGPNNADGSAPPVLATIQSDGNLFNPAIRQLYATGEAAISAATNNPCGTIDTSDQAQRRLMFFGTSTNVGLSIGTTTNVPDSFAFGYKRKEFSLIPLVKDGDTYTYPSVLASIDTTGQLGDRTSTADVALSNNQMFATGKAACHLAQTLHQEFVDRARLSVDDQQRVEAGRAINCYSGVRLRDRVGVWRDADHHELYHEKPAEAGNTLKLLLAAFDSAVTDGVVENPDQLFRADRLYSSSVFIKSPGNTERLARLSEHRGYVCGLSRSNQSGR